MTPKEKANELLSKFVSISLSQYVDLVDGIRIRLAKECALIAVDEILKSEPLEPNNTPDWLQPEDWFSEANKYAGEYWIEVKKEIEAL